MERRILSVLQRMQEHLNENQLRELKTVLQVVFHDCDIVQKTEVMVVDNCVWTPSDYLQVWKLVETE